MRKFWFILIVLGGFAPLFVSAASPINILLVPGHDEEVWGAQYGNVKEAAMNLILATELFNILKKDKRFKVQVTRDVLGYTTTFADYFSRPDEITAFKEEKKKNMKIKIAAGGFTEVSGVPHHGVNNDISLRLYGINKWANENKIDAVIHIHFDDYPRSHSWTKGKYKGFTVYVPESQFANSATSMSLGKKIFNELHKKYGTSTYPKEAGGFVQDQTLIALGANDSLISSVRSVLIEYGYIYRFGNNTVRHKAYTTMANLTATGIKNYFFPKN